MRAHRRHRLCPPGWGHAGKPTPVPASSDLTGIGCTSATACYADGLQSDSSQSVVVSVGSGAPGSSIMIAGGKLVHMACVTGGDCLASGFNPTRGLLATIVNGVPGTVSVISSAYDIFAGTCVGAANCEIGGETRTVGLIIDSPV